MPKILLVEDEELVSELYKRLLLLKKYEVLVAANGEDGLALAQDELPDAVLLDIMLPKMDGIEVLRHLKEDDKTKDIPVIMLTNIDDDIALGTAMKLHAADYMVKSDFTPRQVMEHLEKQLV